MQIRILLVSSILLFFGCSKKNQERSSLLSFVPENASVVFKINDFQTFTTELEKNELIGKLGKLEAFYKISQSVSALRYARPTQESLISFTADSLRNMNFTFVSNDTVSYLDLSNVLDKTIETLSYDNLVVLKYKVEGTEFYTSRYLDKEVVSSSLEQLKQLLTNVKTRTPNPQLTKFYHASDKTKLGHIWINLNHTDFLWSYLTKSKRKISSFTDWLFLDVSLDNDGLSLNGVSTVETSANKYLNLFSGTAPLANGSFEMIPKNATSITSFTFENYYTFATNQSNYLEQGFTADSLFNTVEEIGTAFINNQQIVLIKTYGTDELTDYLKQIRLSTIDFQGNEIWELSTSSFLENRLQPTIENFESNYCSFLENTLVFASEQETIKQVITAYKSGNVITETAFFQDIKELTTQESSILNAVNSFGLQHTLNKNGLSKIAEEFKTTDFSDYLFGSEMIADEGFFHASYFIKKIGTKKTKESVSTVFKVPFDLDIVSGPQFVLNHQTKKGELIVQDADNVLYLISNNGNILWEKQLKSPIQGKVHQVDLFKNGKLQLAFTTANRFMILDRNGDTVKPFYFDFPQGVLNPLAVFDYDGKKDYRFVVTQNNSVFMYNNKAKIVSGFKYTSSEEDILDAPQHFRIKRKDYLVFKLAGNTLKILNRVGKERIKIKEKIPFSDNPVRLFEGKIIVTSTDGILHQINTSGAIEKTNLQLNSDHGMDASSKTLAIINDNTLSIRGKKTTLDLGVYSKPSIFYLNDKIYVSVTDIQNQKTYLFDSQSKPIPGFPVFGMSSIDMMNMDTNKKPELVIKDQENSITVYKLN